MIFLEILQNSVLQVSHILLREKKICIVYKSFLIVSNIAYNNIFRDIAKFCIRSSSYSAKKKIYILLSAICCVIICLGI